MACQQPIASLPVFLSLFELYSNSLLLYMIAGTPYTFTRFLIGIVHFFVASEVAE